MECVEYEYKWESDALDVYLITSVHLRTGKIVYILTKTKMKVKTPDEIELEKKIRDELELLTKEINKAQAKIDETEPSTWLLKDLVKAREALIAQRNAKINLLNTVS